MFMVFFYFAEFSVHIATRNDGTKYQNKLQDVINQNSPLISEVRNCCDVRKGKREMWTEVSQNFNSHGSLREQTQALDWKRVVISYQVTGEEIKKKKKYRTTIKNWIQIFNLLVFTLKEAIHVRKPLSLRQTQIVPYSSTSFIFHLRVCWCSERREAASADSGDKTCCCGCGGGWSYLPVAEGAFSSLQAAALHYVSPLLCQHSPWAPQSQLPHARGPEEHMVSSSACTLPHKQWQKVVKWAQTHEPWRLPDAAAAMCTWICDSSV